MFRSVFLIAAGAALLAQEPIRVDTRLVQVNVVVRTGNGAVAGLTKDDFKLFDKGKERTIAVFTVATAERLVPAAAGTDAAHAMNPETAQLDPGVFTNRPETTRNSAVSATVLLIDALNTDSKDQQSARKQLLKFIASTDTSRRVAIYLLGDRIRVLQDFTDDPTRLQKAATKYQGEGSAVLRGATSPAPYTDDAAMAMDPTIAMLRESFNEMNDFHQVDRALTTAKAMEQIAAHLARVPGRKTLIWLSSGFPFALVNDERHAFLAAAREERSFNDEVQRAVRALSAADVAIYPVDARGLLGMPAFDPANPPDSLGTRRQAFGKNGNGQLGVMSVDTPEGLETMNALAAGTGGRAFYNTNDLQGAVAKAMDDADVSYTLGFYASDAPDGTFHDLKVKVDRPGVETRHRAGYFFGVEKAPGEKDRVTLMRDVAASALDATAIGLMAAIEPSSEPKAGALRLILRLNLEDCSLEERSGKWIGGADIAFVSQAADGKPLAFASKTLTFDLTDEVYRARKRDGVTIEQILDPNPKLNRIRVVVLDHRSGGMGSLSLTPKR